MGNQDIAECINNTGFEASLEPRKLYWVVHDSDAEADNLIRVVDEAGQDYVYPAELFHRLSLPAETRQALHFAS